MGIPGNLWEFPGIYGFFFRASPGGSLPRGGLVFVTIQGRVPFSLQSHTTASSLVVDPKSGLEGDKVYEPLLGARFTHLLAYTTR